MEHDTIICRLCLEVVPVGYTLKENIQNTVKVLTSIDVSENDSLPKLSCSKCILNLHFVESIRKLIMKSHEKLRTIFTRCGNFDELLKCNNAVSQISCDVSDNNIEINEEKVFQLAIKVPKILEECVDLGVNSANNLKDTPPKQDKNSTDNVNKDENITNSIISRKTETKPCLYHCDLCNVDFSRNKLYMQHKEKHIKKTCEICGVTTRRDNFLKHMKNHALGQQICDFCGSKHKSFAGLRTHLFNFHNAKKKPYVCTECGEKFKYSGTLIHHKRKIHTGFRPYQCETCGKRFMELDTMKRHVKLIHLKLREYHCKYCQKDYSTRYALKVHMRQHTHETPYMCEFCTEGFRQMVSLKTHLARYHKEKPSTSQTEDEFEKKEKEEEGEEETS